MNPAIEAARGRAETTAAEFAARDAALDAATEKQALLVDAQAKCQADFDDVPTDDEADALEAATAAVKRGKLFVEREQKLHKEAFIASEKADAEVDRLTREHFDGLLDEAGIDELLSASAQKVADGVRLILDAQEELEEAKAKIVLLANERENALKTGKTFQVVQQVEMRRDISHALRILVARALPERVRMPLFKEWLRYALPREEMYRAVQEGRF